MTQFDAITDLALPSFEDEARLWGDDTPEKTIAGLRHAGPFEILVKNGAKPVQIWSEETSSASETDNVVGVQKTASLGSKRSPGDAELIPESTRTECPPLLL